MPLTSDELAGWKAGQTSQWAAEEVAPTAEKMVTIIRACMKRHIRPMTADEIADATGLDPLSVRPRLTNMKKRNLIRDSGQIGLSKRGKRMTRWEIC